MLCNLYIREQKQELKRMGIRSSSPVFFINLTNPVYNKLKSMMEPKVLEVYPVQDDPYFKNLSNTWMNGGVQLPETKIVEVEKIIQLPPKIIEKTIEVPVEVIREVQVIKEVPVEVIKEVTTESPSETLNESTMSVDDGDSILIDTKVAYEDWKAKNITPKAEKEIDQAFKEEKAANTKEPESVVEETDTSESVKEEEAFVVPEVVEDILIEEDVEPILLEEQPDNVEEEIPVTKPRRGRKKKIQEVQEVQEEFTVELTEEELKIYEDVKSEE
jgi:hypothetical protein